jgi:hypothetical protein
MMESFAELYTINPSENIASLKLLLSLAGTK